MPHALDKQRSSAPIQDEQHPLSITHIAVLSFPPPATLWHCGCTCMRRVGSDHAPGEVRSLHHFSAASNEERPCGNSGLNSSATLLAVRSSCSTRHTLALRVDYRSHPHFVCNFLRISLIRRGSSTNNRSRDDHGENT